MKKFAIRNVNKETPTYFKEVFCGDERQIITTDIPEKIWELETAWAIASLLNMNDKSGGHWETPELNYDLWLSSVKNKITKISGSEEETNRYIEEYAESESLFNNDLSIEYAVKEIIDFHNFHPTEYDIASAD
jgi:hypothetical protein